MARKQINAEKKTVKKSARTTKAKNPAAPVVNPPTQVMQTHAVEQPPASVKELEEQLRRGDLASRSEAAIKLGALGDENATAALVEALRDPTAEVAKEAALALGRMKYSTAIHALMDVVLNRDGYFHSIVRAAAAESLGNLYDPRAVEALVVAVRDPICETSLAAIGALAKIGDARALPALQATAANADGFFLPQAQQAATAALETWPN